MDLDESFSSFNPEGDYQYYKENVPPGFRFDDTDDLMLSYLLSKEQGHPLANTLFKQVPLYNYNPEELQNEFNNGEGDEMYFYTKTKPLNNGRRVGRKTGKGRWKTMIGEKNITRDGKTIGNKTTLSFFYRGKEGKEKKTCWNMHEYKLQRENGKRKRRDDVVLCKIYKRGGAGKAGEAIDEENNEETGGSIGSCNYLQSSTTVSNGLGQSFPDVHSLEWFETEDLVTPTNGSSDLPMAAVNDPFRQFAVSPIEDSATPMNIFYQFARLPPIEHLATPMNDWGDFTMADVNEHAIQFLGSPVEDFNSQMANFPLEILIEG